MNQKDLNKMTRSELLLEEQRLLRGKTYLKNLPVRVPAGRALVHNQVRPRRTLGLSGFRAWLQEPGMDPKLEVCSCGWAPELGEHFRVVRVFARKQPNEQ